MKKIIIFLVLSIFVLVFSSYNSYSYSGSFDNITEKNNLRDQASIRIIKLQNRRLQEKIIELDNNNSENELNNKKLKENIENLEKQNNKLKIKNDELNNKINEKKELGDIIKALYDYVFGDFQKSMEYQPDEEKLFFYTLMYLIFSLFIFIFFFVFTLPLRLIRGIWRLFTGYKPCVDKGIKSELDKLMKQYRDSIKQNEKLANDNFDLVNDNGNLKNKNKKLKEKNYKLNLDIQKKEISDVKEKINNNKLKKEEEIFHFEKSETNFKISFSDNNKIKEKKSFTINSEKRDKLNIFNKDRKRFNLNSKKNNKSKLFQ